MKIFLIVIVVLIAARFARGYFLNKTPRPTMPVLKDLGSNIQIRTMPEQIFASVTVTGTESQAPTGAFRVLAGFIFGGNTTKKSVAMTAPVITQKTSESIAMTAPVISQKSGEGSYEVSFLMPAGYTLESLPIPNDKSIRIHSVPSKTIAVITFDGYTTQSRVDSYRKTLLSQLQTSGITTTGETLVAQYNDPRTPPMMRTNEIWIEVTAGF